MFAVYMYVQQQSLFMVLEVVVLQETALIFLFLQKDKMLKCRHTLGNNSF